MFRDSTSLAKSVVFSDSKFFSEDDPNAIVALIQVRPGSYENLGRLIEIDPTALTPAGRIDYLAALEKQHSWVYSLIQEATLAIAGAEPSESEGLFDGVDETEREDIATALRLSPNTAQSRIDVARTLSNNLPATCAALASGEISSAHATLIARETADALIRGVSPDILSVIESKALAHSEFHTAAQVGKKLRTLFAQYAPEVFEESSDVARDTRSVRIFPEGDGMSTLIALLPAEDAQTVYLAINEMINLDSLNKTAASSYSATDFNNSATSSSHATNIKGSAASSSSATEMNDSASCELDNRSMEMKRADALTAIASEFLTRSNKEGGAKGRRPVTLNLTMDLPTLLGLSENPAQLSGHGPIPASIARKLAADAKWRKFITDPLTGNLLDMGRDSYLPSQYLVDFLTARDRTCRFPGCSQPARVGDIDHAKPWEEGGETKPSNLGFLCRRHHRLKTHGKWKLDSHDDGSCTWLSPTGNRFFVPARPLDESATSNS